MSATENLPSPMAAARRAQKTLADSVADLVCYQSWMPKRSERPSGRPAAVIFFHTPSSPVQVLNVLACCYVKATHPEIQPIALLMLTCMYW